MTIKTIYIFLFILLGTTHLIGQTKNDTLTLSDILRLPMADSTLGLYPLTRDSTGKFPKRLFVTGKIVDVTIGTSCGVTCGCGTIKIMLAKKPKHYHDKNVFIAIPCFVGNSIDFINKTIKIKTKILGIDNKDCFWNEVTNNKIDSEGIPFYIPDKLFQKINIKQ